MPTPRSELLAALALAGCGAPGTTVSEPAPAADVDAAELEHEWTVAAHVIGTKTTMSEDDARAMHGRKVTVRERGGYTTPWHGTCEEAKRGKQKIDLVELSADVDLSSTGRAQVRAFGIERFSTAYTLTCSNVKVPPLELFVAGTKAMTCFGGVCYLLQR